MRVRSLLTLLREWWWRGTSQRRDRSDAPGLGRIISLPWPRGAPLPGSEVGCWSVRKDARCSRPRSSADAGVFYFGLERVSFRQGWARAGGGGGGCGVVLEKVSREGGGGCSTCRVIFSYVGERSASRRFVVVGQCVVFRRRGDGACDAGVGGPFQPAGEPAPSVCHASSPPLS